MGDRWLNEHIEIELKKAEGKPNLQEILKEGFFDTGNIVHTYNLYELDDERIFYNKYNDMIVSRFNIVDLMRGIC